MEHIVPCRQDIDAPELAELLLVHLNAFVGMPRNLVSDRGSLFTSAMVTDGTICV